MIIIAGHEIVDAGDQRPIRRCLQGSRDRLEVVQFISRARTCCRGLHPPAITADSVDPRRVNNAEVWESAEALDHWRAQAKAPDPGIKTFGGDMRRFDATDGGPLF